MRVQAAAAIWRDLHEDLRLAVSLADLGLNAWVLGDSPHAVEHLEESLRLFDSYDRSPGVMGYTEMTLRNRGLVARTTGDYTRAAECFSRSILEAREARWMPGYNIARSTCQLGATMFLQGDLRRAEELLRDALARIQEEHLSGHTLPDCLDWVAALARARGQTWDAAVLYGAADAQWEESGAVRYAPDRLTHAAALEELRGSLTARDFSAAQQMGRNMSREQAIEFALSTTG